MEIVITSYSIHYTKLYDVAIPETIFNNDNVYLGITIESDTEMSPRKRLSAVPYAFNAGALLV